MKKQIYQNIKQIFMTCFMCLIAFVFSFNSIYAEETGSITVDTPTEEMKVSLYRIGEFTDQGTFTLTKPYQSYAVSLDHSSSEKWQATANILAQYIQRDGIDADEEGMSSSNQSVTFNDLSCGLYLIVGNEKEVNDSGNVQVYIPQVSLIALPDVSTDDSYHLKTV